MVRGKLLTILVFAATMETVSWKICSGPICWWMHYIVLYFVLSRSLSLTHSHTMIFSSSWLCCSASTHMSLPCNAMCDSRCVKKENRMIKKGEKTMGWSRPLVAVTSVSGSQITWHTNHMLRLLVAIFMGPIFFTGNLIHTHSYKITSCFALRA